MLRRDHYVRSIGSQEDGVRIDRLLDLVDVLRLAVLLTIVRASVLLDHVSVESPKRIQGTV